MNLLEIIKTKAVQLEIKQNNIFNFSIERQKNYLNSFRNPKDLIERSYFQYKCQMFLYGFPLNIALNIVAFPLFWVYFFSTDNAPSIDENNIDAVFFTDGKPHNILPNKLTSIYHNIKYIDTEKRAYLKKSDRNYLFALWRRYPFAWLFLLKSLIKIRYYSYEVFKTSPQAIIVCNEYSFTSSLLTDYCRKNGIKHINVMHGEKVFFIMDAFFQFDSCYVWDDKYIELFKKLRAEESQFSVCLPESLIISSHTNITKKNDFTYYLGAENGLQLRNIIQSLEKLSAQGKKVSIRPHPRYTDFEELNNVAGQIEIENCFDVSIEESILQTFNVISLFSTVLNQAYHNGIGIVIDDVSDRDKYRRLYEMNYIMLSVDHLLLSECLES